jgi:hypothetical protein
MAHVVTSLKDEVAAEMMRAVDDVLTEWFKPRGYIIGRDGEKWVVRDAFKAHDYHYIAYSYADCVKWCLAKIDEGGQSVVSFSDDTVDPSSANIQTIPGGAK